MRISTLTVALTVVTAFGLPAQAAQYTCTFYQANNPVGTCRLDSANPGKLCEHKFSPTVTASCLAQPVGVNLLACSLHDPNISAADFGKGPSKSSQSDVARVLAEQPGFGAVGAAIAFGTSWPSNALVAYRENSNSPTFQAGCTD